MSQLCCSRISTLEARLEQLDELLVEELALVELVLHQVLVLVGSGHQQQPVVGQHAAEARPSTRLRIGHVLDRLEADDQVERAVARTAARARRRDELRRRDGASARVRDGALVDVHARGRARARGGKQRGSVALAAGRVEHSARGGKLQRPAGSAPGARRAPPRRAAARARAARRWPVASPPPVVTGAPARSSPIPARTDASACRARTVIEPRRATRLERHRPEHAAPGVPGRRATEPGRSSSISCMPARRADLADLAPTGRAC